MTNVNVILTAASALATVLSAGLAIVAIRAANVSTNVAQEATRIQKESSIRSDTTAIIVEMISRQLSDDEFLDADRNVGESLRTLAAENRTVGVDDLEECLRRDFIKVAVFFESLGALTFIKSVDEDLVVALIRTRIISTYELMAPLIERERTTSRHPTYLEFFESLYAGARQLSPEEIRTRFSLQKSPDRRP